MAYKSKLLFNSDLTKQVQEVIFSTKNIKTDHAIVYFNEAPVAHTTYLSKTPRYAFRWKIKFQSSYKHENC